MREGWIQNALLDSLAAPDLLHDGGSAMSGKAAPEVVSEKVVREITALSKRYSHAYIAKDVSALDRILADDWTLITAGCGDEVYKRGQLKDLKDGTLQVHGIEDSDVRVRVFGNSAVVTGKRASKVTYNGRDVSDVARFSQFYVHGDDGWQCVSTQVTSVRPDPDRAAG
jgi:ketosteroid isomerase-like protein